MSAIIDMHRANKIRDINFCATYMRYQVVRMCLHKKISVDDARERIAELDRAENREIAKLTGREIAGTDRFVSQGPLAETIVTPCNEIERPTAFDVQTNT